MKIIIQLITNAIAILLAVKLIPEITFIGDLFTLIMTGFVLGLINFFLKPLLKLISAPLIILSLGLFIIVINMGLLWLLNIMIEELTIAGFWAYFWGTIIISAVNIFIEAVIKKEA